MNEAVLNMHHMLVATHLMQDRSVRDSVRDWQWKLSWLKGVIITLLVLGTILRFINLDRKVYWYDETLTSLRVFGYTKIELQESFHGQVVQVAELQKYQQPSPDKGWDDTLTALKGNAEHPPLYYLLARLWATMFGSSVAAMRSLPAVISLLAFPCVYWLCRELFDSTLTGWVAMGLIAISPFQVLYAQEAREYSLWTIAILLSSAALLKAVRLNTLSSWTIYAVTVALGLYTHILGGLVTFAHGVYLLLCYRRRKTLIPFLTASVVGALTFLPWAMVIFNQMEQIHTTTEGVRRELSTESMVDRWLANLNRVFFDIDLDYVNLENGNIIVLVLVVFVLVWLCRQTPSVSKLFILVMITATVLPLLLPDLLIGGRRSGVFRYLIPCYLSIQLAVAHFLATQLAAQRQWQHRVGRTALLSLTLAGMLSILISSQAEVWWTKSIDRSGSYPQIARLINRTEAPLLISDSSRAIGTLSISHLLKPNVSLKLLPEFRRQRIPSGFSDVFVLDGSKGYFRKLRQQQHYKAIRMFFLSTDTFSLWRLKK
jgi:uncharacterized membrane protein